MAAWNNTAEMMEAALAKTLQKINTDRLAPVLRKRALSVPSSSEDASSTKNIHKQQKQEPQERNEYSGWQVPSSNYIIPTISVDDLTPEAFYEKFVSHRRPVVLRGEMKDLVGLRQWRHTTTTTQDHNGDGGDAAYEYLQKVAGDKHVMVEYRTNSKHTYGRGNETRMTFKKFLTLVKSGDAMHYLTTQDVRANQDGRPDLMAPFMKPFLQAGDFPLQPKITGNLIPQNINIWMGNNQQGTSSGLHHDYHDNLYVVLRGTKRFRLFSPKDTEKMYTKGKLTKVHPNGRINYQGQVTTAYGADLQADAAAKASDAKEIAEQKLIEAEQAVAEGRPGAELELERAEEMLEEAMDALLDAEMDSEEEGGRGYDDDSDDDEGDVDTLGNDNDNDNNSGNNEDENENEKDTASSSSSVESKGRLVDKTVKDPDNFSNIPLDLLNDMTTTCMASTTPGTSTSTSAHTPEPSPSTNEQAVLRVRQEFPELLHAKSAFCEVRVGDTLYLPASWFHEVTSFGGQDGEGHMAMNYWFHPPDASNDFDHPYTSDFWPNDFKDRFVRH